METKSSSAAPWLVDETKFPKDGSMHEKLQFIMHYAILASSFYDSQPWQFSISDTADEIDIYADRSRWLDVADPDKHELYISLGCALENLLIAIDYFGMGHKSVAYMPEPGNEEWAVRVKIATPRMSSVPREHRLLAAIDNRNAYVMGFRDQPLSSDEISEVVGFVSDFIYEDTTMSHRVELDTLDDKWQKNELVQSVSSSDVSLFSNSEFRRELSTLLSDGQYDNPVFSDELRSLDTDPEVGSKIGKKESAIIANAPYVGVLSSNFDDPTGAIKVGQAFERITLQAKLKGVGVYPVFQLLATPEMRTRVQDMLPDLKGVPQLVFAMGHVERQIEQAVMPRIPLEQVMRHS